MPLSTFSIHTTESFAAYLKLINFQRKITFIQNHHTFSPNYTSFFDRPDHLFWLESMRAFHIKTRKWKDIGQHLTIFPDGKIGLCRPLDTIPAGIFGANTGAICIENLGDFDAGKDEMKEEQKKAIIQVNALLCLKFSLKPVYEQVVYHHWFDTTGKRFPPAMVDNNDVNRKALQKTCPGTGFFGGNRIKDAIDNFYPLINQVLQAEQSATSVPIQFVSKRVTASVLNVRSGRGTGFSILRKLPKDATVQVYNEIEGWSKINLIADEWVSSVFLTT